LRIVDREFRILDREFRILDRELSIFSDSTIFPIPDSRAKLDRKFRIFD